MHMVLYCERQIDSATTSNTHGGTHIRPVLSMKEKPESMVQAACKYCLTHGRVRRLSDSPVFSVTVYPMPP